MATAEPRSGVHAVDPAIQVLSCFEGDPELSVSKLAQLADPPVSTVHRPARALVRGRLLEQDDTTDRYRIGHGPASLARRGLDRLGIESAAPRLYALTAGIRITVSVSVARDRDAVTVFQARPAVFPAPIRCRATAADRRGRTRSDRRPDSRDRGTHCRSR
ncbi:helix-turn-helix domain-containing protein [Nocardia sp. NBC_01503]|uniref:helix-turn-helix domain-containing protein n=1 Tax=Nocardia sp. NBC_01503 TaxID=2975997 RepID=UPI002E7C3F12|nr:helix-turn-helix domain-containing protein [Nocardia sp. NBC_01503]WTL31028.1 helix-turn-helix domain-containing protein [Nocardia sp. NBC_01503]